MSDDKVVSLADYRAVKELLATSEKVEQVSTVNPLTTRYSEMIMDSLRGMIKNVIIQTATSGLLGKSLYITFDATMKGVVVPKRFMNNQELVIVLEHQFWDLTTDEDSFSVSLSFDGKLSRIKVPFMAVQGFSDPSASFTLQLDSVV